MQRIHRISVAERDAILASTYPETHVVMWASDTPCSTGTGGQLIDFGASVGGVGVPPLEYAIQPGDTVTVWWQRLGAHGGAPRAIAINGRPPIIYAWGWMLADEHARWIVEVVDRTDDVR